MRKVIICLVCLLANPLSGGARDKQQQADARAMLQKAREISNIRDDGSPPFELRAVIQFVHMGKETVEGKYQLIWVSPDRWREEVLFPDFRDVRARDESVSWHARDRIFEPFKVRQISALMFVASFQKSVPEKENLKIREQTLPAGKFPCVSHKSGMGEESDYCFYPSTGSLAFVLNPLYITEYAEYAPFGEKTFPRKMSVVVKRKPSIVVVVTKLEKLDHPDAAIFAPPSGAEIWPSCEAPLPPQILTPVLPLRGPLGPGGTPFDQSLAKMTYFEIGRDGKVQNALPLEEDGSVSSAKSSRVISQMRFGPATCDKTPIPGSFIVRSVL